MEADKFELIEEWIAKWDDLTEFEVVLVQDSPTNAAQQGGCTCPGDACGFIVKGCAKFMCIWPAGDPQTLKP